MGKLGNEAPWSAIQVAAIQSPQLHLLPEVHILFTSQNKVYTSRHRICLRWHYALVSHFLTAFSSSKFFLLLPLYRQQRVLPSLPSAGPENSFSQKAPLKVTLSNLLLQAGLNAISEQAAGGFSRQSVKIFSNGDCTTSPACHCALPRSSSGSLSFFRSHGNFSPWSLWLLSFIFMPQSGADPVSSVTTLQVAEGCSQIPLLAASSWAK